VRFGVSDNLARIGNQSVQIRYVRVGGWASQLSSTVPRYRHNRPLCEHWSDVAALIGPARDWNRRLSSLVFTSRCSREEIQRAAPT